MCSEMGHHAALTVRAGEIALSDATSMERAYLYCDHLDLAFQAGLGEINDVVVMGEENYLLRCASFRKDVERKTRADGSKLTSRSSQIKGSGSARVANSPSAARRSAR